MCSRARSPYGHFNFLHQQTIWKFMEIGQEIFSCSTNIWKLKSELVYWVFALWSNFANALFWTFCSSLEDSLRRWHWHLLEISMPFRAELTQATHNYIHFSTVSLRLEWAALGIRCISHECQEFLLNSLHFYYICWKFVNWCECVFQHSYDRFGEFPQNVCTIYVQKKTQENRVKYSKVHERFQWTIKIGD